METLKNKFDTEVIIVGAGPAGLALATELRLQGIDIIVLEKLAVRSGQSKAMNLQPRTAEMLDMRGLLSLAEELKMYRIDEGHFSGIPLYYDSLGTRFPYQIGILQKQVESVLEKRLIELGGTICRNWEVTNVIQDNNSVIAEGTEKLRTRYLVGCDGGKSKIRKLLNIPFPGIAARKYFTISDVVLGPGTKELPAEFTFMGETKRRPDGSFASIVAIDEPGLYRFVYLDPRTEKTEVKQEEVMEAIHTFYGEEYRLLEIRYSSRYSDASRQAEKYRAGRIFLAGDAAHVHPPIGGQGLNLGIQDAFNLGWKLAAVVSGRMPDSFLDTYETERHPVAAHVIDNTRAQTALRGFDPEHLALRETFKKLLGISEASKSIAAMITGIDIKYEGTGYIGVRLPDFQLGSGWASERFHRAHGVLFTRDARYKREAAPWASQIDVILVNDLPLPEVEAVLVRPDGYICWTAPGDSIEIPLTKWFGSPD